MLYSLCVSLILTNIVEIVLAIIKKVRDEESISMIIAINCLTNPVVVFLANMCMKMNNGIRTIVILILEILVVIVEGYWFKNNLKKNKMNAYIFSMYLNIFSFFIGILLSFIY